MINIKLGVSEVLVWQDPWGLKAKINLFSFASEQLTNIVCVNPIVTVPDGHVCSEAELARILALYLENMADSALMMAEEIRKRYG